MYRVPNYWNDNDYDDDPNNNYNDHDHNNNSSNIQLQYSALHEIHCVDLYKLKGDVCLSKPTVLTLLWRQW